MPSTCESIGLRYSGADAYSAIVCQDKGLSKSYARRYGVLSPHGTVFEPGDIIKASRQLDVPLVVKPLMEGGSIGIDQNALCKTWSDVERQVLRLHEKLNCPVIVEEFLQGEEISICLLGANGQDARFAAVRLDVAGYDLAQGIWSMEIKKQIGNSPVNVPVTHELDEDLVRNCRRLFGSFEKMDYMRIDGRMTKDGFRLIELTPDVQSGT